MIAQIRGRLIHKEPGSVVVEANGLGYRVFVSLTTFYEIPDLEQTVILHTHTHVREDALQLFGFSSALEKELFQILIGVTGIGPKLALNILSGIAPEELLHSLDQRDMNRLQSVPGIGRKMAERMVVDLQEKARKIGSRIALAPSAARPTERWAEDVISALLNLGYKKGQAEKAVEMVFRQDPNLALEKALKESLKILAAV
ncbi:MAG: Holliday junction branch migration protein RuvA [Deltaproteobacteria bacterium]|nr:Holliday junction branch migration protein RuvA [Deltaproteobacteria bacterium]